MLLLLVLAGAGGCVHQVKRTSVVTDGGWERGAQLDRAPAAERVAALTAELVALGPEVSPDEAAHVAYLAVHYSEQLADWYRMVEPVEVHNFLANVGMRHGGRCYEYAENILAELREQRVRTLEFRRGIAWRDDFWNEHNCVVVTTPRQGFYGGVVLDGWRLGGQLRFAPVRLDHYPWKPKAPPPKEMVLSRPAPPAARRASAPARSVTPARPAAPARSAARAAGAADRSAPAL